mmetsp:Transcript_7314/g.13525  ORF Transcript_7314/g.13525 Transcript_7314/m.13525 type:complete len:225 (+) Transcript_7314:1231-1905(+)
MMLMSSFATVSSVVTNICRCPPTCCSSSESFDSLFLIVSGRDFCVEAMELSRLGLLLIGLYLMFSARILLGTNGFMIFLSSKSISFKWWISSSRQRVLNSFITIEMQVAFFDKYCLLALTSLRILCRSCLNSSKDSVAAFLTSTSSLRQEVIMCWSRSHSLLAMLANSSTVSRSRTTFPEYSGAFAVSRDIDSMMRTKELCTEWLFSAEDWRSPTSDMADIMQS